MLDWGDIKCLTNSHHSVARPTLIFARKTAIYPQKTLFKWTARRRFDRVLLLAYSRALTLTPIAT